MAQYTFLFRIYKIHISFLKTHFQCSVKVARFSRQPIESEVGVRIPRRPVADTITLLEEAAFPDNVSTLFSCLQVFLIPKHLKGKGNIAYNDSSALQL